MASPTSTRSAAPAPFPLAGTLQQLSAVLDSSRSAGADSQAQQLELVHQLEEQLRLAPEDDVKAAQGDLEKHLTGALLQSPAPPLRTLISSCLCVSYTRGARSSLYTTVQLFISWLSNKSSPASTISSKVAILQVLGDLCEVHGSNMVGLTLDSIALLNKTMRANEVLVHPPPCTHTRPPPA